MGNNSITKKIRCLETNEIFNSLAEASRWCGLKNSSSITNQINGRTKSAGKYPEDNKISLYWEYYTKGEE